MLLSSLIPMEITSNAYILTCRPVYQQYKRRSLGVPGWCAGGGGIEENGGETFGNVVVSLYCITPTQF